MISAIKSELRKLLTVRSTYGIIIATLLIIMLFAGFGTGFRGSAASLQDPHVLASQSSDAIVFVGLVLAFAGLLLAGNEYRYTTIMYTLADSNRRFKVVAAKFFVITLFALVTSLMVVFFSPLCTILGAHLAGHTIGAQTFDTWTIIWRCLFCGWGYVMYAFILVLILRNQIGAIVTFLLIPLIGENIMMSVLKGSTKYLPFNAVQSVAEPMGLGNHTTVGRSVLTVLAYVVVGGIVAAVLFIRRDAN